MCAQTQHHVETEAEVSTMLLQVKGPQELLAAPEAGGAWKAHAPALPGKPRLRCLELGLLSSRAEGENILLWCWAADTGLGQGLRVRTGLTVAACDDK